MNEGRKPATGRKRVWLSVLISATLLAFMAWKTEIRLSVVQEQFRRLDPVMLASVFSFSVIFHIFVGADKWWRILRALGAPVGYWEVFRVRLGSDPIRFTAPLKSGELVNAVYFAKLESFGFSRSAGSIVFDKSLNFFGEVFWLYVGIAAMAAIPSTGYLALHTAIGVGVLSFICIRPVRHAAMTLAGRIHHRLGKLASGVLSAFEEFSLLQKVGFLFYGVVFQLRPLVVCWLVFMAFETRGVPSLPEFIALGSAVVLMSNMPSLGGIGPREATLMAMFSNFADPATLLSVGVLMSLAVQVCPAIVGLPFMFPLLRELTTDTGRAAQ